jgi:hypothetical protein
MVHLIHSGQNGGTRHEIDGLGTHELTKETTMKFTVLARITGTALLTVLAIPVQIRGQEEQEHKREHHPHFELPISAHWVGTTASVLESAIGGLAGGAATATQNGNPNQGIPRRLKQPSFGIVAA